MKLTITRRSDIALRALRLLRTQSDTVQAAEMAAELSTTPAYLPQIMAPLVRAGWVESGPGPRGGYRLSAGIGAVSLLALIELIEGPIDSGVCVLRGGPCGGPTCALHGAWERARTALTSSLAEVPVFPPAPIGGER